MLRVMYYSKDDLREDFDLLIQAWLKSDNENTTYLADSLATYAVEKLNGEIRESCGEFCTCSHLSIHFYGEICEHCNKPIVFQNSEERT